MNQRALTIKDLEAAGYEFYRHGTNHDVYRHKTKGWQITVKRHQFDNHDRLIIQKEIKHNEERKGG